MYAVLSWRDWLHGKHQLIPVACWEQCRGLPGKCCQEQRVLSIWCCLARRLGHESPPVIWAAGIQPVAFLASSGVRTAPGPLPADRADPDPKNDVEYAFRHVACGGKVRLAAAQQAICEPLDERARSPPGSGASA